MTLAVGSLRVRTCAAVVLAGSLALASRVSYAQSDAGASADASAPSGAAVTPPASAGASLSASDAGTGADASGDASASPAAPTRAAPAGGASPAAAGDDGGDEGDSGRSSRDDDERARTLTPEQTARLRPDDGELPSSEDRGPHRFLLPPYMYEWGNGHHTRVVFPFYFESQVRDSFRLFIPPYYQSRTPTSASDVFFPFVFHFHGTGERNARYATNVIPPFWLSTSTGPGRAHSLYTGVAPLFSYGERFDERGRLEAEHLVIPPALTYHRWWPTGQTTVVGPVVYVRNGATTDFAVAPFYFHHRSPSNTWHFALPFIYNRVDHENGRSLSVVGPLWWETGRDLFSFNVAPLFFHRREGSSSRTTFFPLFHTEQSSNHFTFATPLGGYTRVGNEHTLVLPFYQQHRGVTNWDALAPLPFFYSRTPQLGRSTWLVLNVFSDRSPTGYAWGFLPFVARFHEDGRYDTTATPLFVHSTVESTRSSVTWVFPTIHVERSPDASVLNVYPLWYSARGRTWHHNVFFPLVWDVGDETTGRQITIAAPFYGRVQDRSSYTQWIFPFFVNWESRRGGDVSYGWDIFPFVQWGSPRRGDHYWSIFEGLVGYRRQGGYEQLRLFWAPITLAGTPPSNENTASGGTGGTSGGTGGSGGSSGGGAGSAGAPQARAPRADVLLDL